MFHLIIVPTYVLKHLKKKTGFSLLMEFKFKPKIGDFFVCRLTYLLINIL